jgi:hypothetical protein
MMVLHDYVLKRIMPL